MSYLKPSIRIVRFYSRLMCLCWSVLLMSPVHAGGFDLFNIRHLFDLTAAEGTSLALPTDVAVTSKRIYVLDGANNRVVVYDLTGKFLFTIGVKGKTAGLFDAPVGLTVSETKLYIADTGNHKVRVFTLDGKLLNSFSIVAEGRPERPIDIETSNNGNEIYVTGNNRHQVMVYNPAGKLLRKWGGRGEDNGLFRYPATIATLGKNAKVIVDVLNSRAQIFSNEGKFLSSIGKKGVLPGRFFRPKGVAVDEKQHIYVSDSYMDVIQVFDRDGDLLFILGNKNDVRRFKHPAGMAIRGDRLYVAEVLNNKISVFKLKQ